MQSQVSGEWDLCKIQAPSFFSVSRPSLELANIVLLKWKDPGGNTQRFQLLKHISNGWHRMGILLGMEIAELDNIQQKWNDNEKRCIEVLNYWLDGSGRDSYPVSWDGLCELLCDVEKATAAGKLESALAKC